MLDPLLVGGRQEGQEALEGVVILVVLEALVGMDGMEVHTQVLTQVLDPMDMVALLPLLLLLVDGPEVVLVHGPEAVLVRVLGLVLAPAAALALGAARVQDPGAVPVLVEDGCHSHLHLIMALMADGDLGLDLMVILDPMAVLDLMVVTLDQDVGGPEFLDWCDSD